MVYPSHFAKGFKGYKDPNQYPYEIMAYSMQSALKRANVYQALQKTKAMSQDALGTASSKLPVIHSKLRPWIQDFTLGKVTYDKVMVEHQMHAIEDVLGEQFAEFMLWNPSNIYTKEALMKPLVQPATDAAVVAPN